jgi:hypothetical protein
MPTCGSASIDHGKHHGDEAAARGCNAEDGTCRCCTPFVMIRVSLTCAARSLTPSQRLSQVRRSTRTRDEVRFHGADCFELPLSVLDGPVNRGCVSGGISDGNGHGASARGGLVDA